MAHGVAPALFAAAVVIAAVAGGACGAFSSADAFPAAPDDGGPPPDSDTGSDSASPCGDTSSSAKNCGRCDNVCANGGACNAGRCGNVVEVETGSNVSCAVVRDGSVWCWGSNSSAEIGKVPVPTDPTCGVQGDAGGVPEYSRPCMVAPTRIDGITDAVHVAVGEISVCALPRDGHAVYCWGGQYAGILGTTNVPDTCGQTPCRHSPYVLDGMPADRHFVQLRAGAQADCARTDTGELWCWGGHAYGARGGSPSANTLADYVPTKLADGVVDFDISAFFHMCIVDAMGVVRCVGDNESGQLGHAVTEDSSVVGCQSSHCNGALLPVDDPTIKDAVSVHAGAGFSCALMRSGVLACWGANDRAQLGNPAAGLGSVAGVLPVSGFSTVLGAAAGASRGYEFGSGGAVKGWGQNGGGSLGATAGDVCKYHPDDRCVDTALDLPALTGVVQMAERAGQGLALMEDGRVLAWGYNEYGQLGHAPGTAGDVSNCGVSNPYVSACSVTPTEVRGLP